MSDSRAACLIVSHEIWETVAPALAGNIDLRKVIMIGADAPAGTLSYSEFLAPAKPQTAVYASDDECAFWLYSLGSTGLPKGVRHVHSALWATAETYGAQVLGIREEDTIFSAAKIFCRWAGKCADVPHVCGGDHDFISRQADTGGYAGYY